MEPYIKVLINSVAEKGKCMLEVGCGIGYDLREFARRGMKVVGIDLSSKNALLTQKGLEIFQLKGNAFAADVECLPFKKESFDLVYSFRVLHHTPNTQQAIDEIYRVLKPEGKCAMMLYHRGIAYYYIMLVHGFLMAKLIFTNKESLLSKYYDHTPLSKIYSSNEAKAFLGNLTMSE